MTRVPPPLDPALIAQRPVATESIVTPSQLEWLFTCCAADAQFFEEASNLIQAHHFRADEVVYRIVWEGITRCYERYNGVDYMSLAYEVGGYLQRDAMVRLTPEQHYELFAQDGGFLAALTSQTDVSAVQFELGRAHLRQFAHERSIIAPLRRMVASGHTAGVPGDMTDMIRATSERLAMISTTQVVPLAEIAPEFGTTMAPSSVFRLTGVAWIDGPLGGQRVGDANGLIGPTGGGKTTMGIHMACEAAKQAWTEMQRDPSQQYRVVFVTAEESADKLRPRIWSNFFEMKRSELEGDIDWNGFSRQGSLKEYEVRRQHGQQHMLSEYDRYMMHAESCNKVLKVLDTSGSDKYPNAGGGFIAEIASYLARMQQENVGFWSVFIDYAGLVVERYLQAKGLNHDEYRTLLKTFGDRCRKEISERFQTTTWILHQLKGQEGSASPTKLQSHVGAGESRDFANNMAVCGCLGTEHKATGCRFLNWSKIRYRPGVVMPPVVLRIGDEIAEMECVTNQFVPSLAGGAFMPRAEANAVQGSSNDLQSRRVDADIAEVEV